MCSLKMRLVLLALLPVLLAAAPASATDFCIVQKSVDGFVALRATPSANGRLLHRARAGQAVVIQKNEMGDQIANGPWLRVKHFSDTVAPPETNPAYKKGKLGWMHRRYVDACG